MLRWAIAWPPRIGQERSLSEDCFREVWGDRPGAHERADAGLIESRTKDFSTSLAV